MISISKSERKNKRQSSFLCQYAYARISSIARTLKINLKDYISINSKTFKPNDYEEKILRKIFEWPKIIESAANKFEPHKILFICMSSQLYFTLIGAKAMKILIIDLYKMVK